MDHGPAEQRVQPGRALRGKRLLEEFAPHDWLVLLFMLILVTVSLCVPSCAAQRSGFAVLAGLSLFHVVTVSLVRSGALKQPHLRALLYRFAIFLPVLASYFILGSLLPLVNPNSLDAQLYALDIRVFGIEPSLVFDHLVIGATSEWFAFFYYCYFIVLALHVIPILFFSKRPRLLGEFSFGFILCFCTGHLLYMVVPGFGPFRAFPAAFSNDFPSGQWVDLVMATVATGGAQKDIFPSLHTAAPTFIALLSYRNRHIQPFRYTWIVLSFFALNIVIATMFLRWHYVIDIVAGLALAGVALELGMRFTEWELRRRSARSLSPSWPLLPAQLSRAA